jgi:hypothetical protein
VQCPNFQRITSPLMMTSWPNWKLLIPRDHISLNKRNDEKVVDWLSYLTVCILTMIGTLYPVRHKICVSWCLLHIMITMAILIGVVYWQCCWNDYGGNECLLIANLIALTMLFAIELAK